MAFSSKGKYQVFLSFRGEDTRNNFTSHLYAALHRQGIVTFIDNSLDRGEEISLSILKKIEESKISVVIFSKDYASSPWCLDELLKIIECMGRYRQKVIPVFYHVDPEDVRVQAGSFSVAFAKHEENFKQNIGKVRRWRIALRKAADLSGFTSTDFGPESTLVEEIVKDIKKKLRHLGSYNFVNLTKDLIGIQYRVERVKSLLRIGLSDVRIVGIWGMGGIGKTTIARVLFDIFFYHFESTCFLANVREESAKRGLESLRDVLLRRLLGEATIGTSNLRQTFVKNQLRHKKVFIVLDDVDDFEQLDILAGKRKWFGAGSRILITSRDKQVFQDRVDRTYEVQTLNYHEALRLFSFFAFKNNHPKEDQMELSNRVVSYANGNPLALKVLGLFLYGKTKEEWESQLQKLERCPYMQIQKVLKISYDGLDDDEQQIFLNIACFLKGEPVSCVVDILNSCGLATLVGLRVLADRALIFISNLKVEMHDLLQEMGRGIVCQESREPGERSRLWNPEDICHVLTQNTGTPAVEGIFFDKSKINGLRLAPTVFEKMNRIKLLKFHKHGNGNDMFFPHGLESLPDDLRYLHWDAYPMKSLPSNFHPENLVEFNMSSSIVERLWDGVQNLGNLKVFKLRNCNHLIEMPNLSRARNLVTIDFRGCSSLIEISPSIDCLYKLVALDLEDCKMIKSVPSTTSLKSLKFVNLYGCSNLSKFPEVSKTVEDLNLKGTAIDEVPISVSTLSQLKTLYLRDCKRLQNLLEIASHDCLSSLRCLNLKGSNLENLPSQTKELSMLEELNISQCTKLQSLPELPPRVKYLNAYGCRSLQTVSTSMVALTEGWERHQFYQEDFFFNNCTKLDQSSCKYISLHAQKRIMQVARAAIGFRKSFDKCEAFVMHFPGNEIPEWIKNQTVGSSISILLQDRSTTFPYQNFNILAFILCVVVELEDSSECDMISVKIEWTRQLQRKYTSSRYYNGIRDNIARAEFYSWPCRHMALKSEHVFLCYDSSLTLVLTPCKHFRPCEDMASFEVKVKGSVGKSVAPLKVKKCGVIGEYVLSWTGETRKLYDKELGFYGHPGLHIPLTAQEVADVSTVMSLGLPSAQTIDE